MTGFKWLALAPVLLVAIAESFVSDKDIFVATWRPISFEREYESVGEREFPMGNAPTDYIHFLPDGHMTVQIKGEGRKAAHTDQDRAGLFHSLGRVTPARTAWMAKGGSQQWTYPQART